MATTTILGSGTRNNRSTVFGAGNITSSNTKALSQVSNATDINKFKLAQPSWKTGVESILKGVAVTITSITQSSSTGFCLITKASHGLSVGQYLVVYGADVTAYNTVHRITSVVSSSTIQTDVFYTSNTSTHGSYKPFSGDFQALTKCRYVGKIIGNYIAGSASSVLRIIGGEFTRFPFCVARGNRRYNVTSWNYATGAATKGANAGDLVQYHDIAANNDTLAFEPYPSRAVPGELTYNAGGKNGAVNADYSQKNG